jgi:glycosyltransferase involved in cell wall biosynthesis
MRYMDRNTGYGQAAEMIYKSFKKLNIDCGYEIDNPDIEICFSNPGGHYWLNEDSYHIAYSAWESTDLDWKSKRVMSQAHELWATSKWVESVWKTLFPTKPTFTYKHGIDSRFKPMLRKKSGSPFTFLHIGEPSSRKDAQMLTECFVELFEGDKDYRLVLKTAGLNTVKVKDPQTGSYASPNLAYDNIVCIDSFLTNEQIVGLYGLCDVFVYPTWGEGFGFQPLEALATGMPVISTIKWADYDKYVTFPVDSEYSYHPWNDVHQGLLLKPNRRNLKEQMVNAVNNYESVVKDTFRNSFKIHEDYDWLNITKGAVERLDYIYKNILRK